MRYRKDLLNVCLFLDLKSETAAKFWSFLHQRIPDSSFRSRDIVIRQKRDEDSAGGAQNSVF